MAPRLWVSMSSEILESPLFLCCYSYWMSGSSTSFLAKYCLKNQKSVASSNGIRTMGKHDWYFVYNVNS